MIEYPNDDPTPNPCVAKTDADGRRHFRVPIPASDRGKTKAYVIAEFSLALFSLEPGSPWSRLIDLIADAVAREIMEEAAGPTVATSMADGAAPKSKPRQRKRRQPPRSGSAA
jgi:hypothetical protein